MKSWHFLLKFYQIFLLKTAGSDYLFFWQFSGLDIFSIKFGNRNIKKTYSPRPPPKVKWLSFNEPKVIIYFPFQFFFYFNEYF
jgi:hypothetical protein